MFFSVPQNVTTALVLKRILFISVCVLILCAGVLVWYFFEPGEVNAPTALTTALPEEITAILSRWICYTIRNYPYSFKIKYNLVEQYNVKSVHKLISRDSQHLWDSLCIIVQLKTASLTVDLLHPMLYTIVVRNYVYLCIITCHRHFKATILNDMQDTNVNQNVMLEQILNRTEENFLKITSPCKLLEDNFTMIKLYEDIFTM